MPDVKENVKEAGAAAAECDAEVEGCETESGSYYYDDSHGYEDFDPDSGDDER